MQLHDLTMQFLHCKYLCLICFSTMFATCFQVLELLADVRGKIPALIDFEGTRSLLQDNPSPLNVVLLQEIQRYNSLLGTIMYELCVCVCCFLGLSVRLSTGDLYCRYCTSMYITVTFSFK